jgi:myo-inositol 2-dehydrogenase/D-chiro-inositol 1-dehydrogenase
VIRVGAIGCGEHATTSLWPLLAPAGLRCVAAWSRTRATVDAAAERFGIPRAYTDVEQMLDECALDAVVVVVPPEALAPLSLAAIERGVHVFAEKPGAVTAREAAAVAGAAARRASSRWWAT